MLRCTDKSKLIRLLELLGNEAEREQGSLPSEETGCVYEGPLDEDATHVLPTESRDVEKGIAVVDGLVILHKMQSTALGTVVDLSHSFTYLLFQWLGIILVFDKYKDVSLKYASREARVQGQCPVQYRILDETHMRQQTYYHEAVPLPRQDKGCLSGLPGKKSLTYNTDSPKLVITSSSGYTRSNGSIEFEDNHHEEADMLMIHHAVFVISSKSS